MSKRAVFDATDEQIERMKTLGLNEKKLGHYASESFEEWLKRREGRANRAALQNKKYHDLLKEST
jgi:hypothetical protein